MPRFCAAALLPWLFAGFACQQEAQPMALCGAAHEAPLTQARGALERSVQHYQPPEVSLVDQDGQTVRLPDALAPGSATALNFIFTTCNTICPVMSAAFAGLRQHAGLKLVSISVDPEHDRPRVLKAYAARYGQAPNWRFLTGGEEDVSRVLAAYGASTGGKTNHRPFTLVRRAGQLEWVRLDGMPTTAALLDELGEAAP